MKPRALLVSLGFVPTLVACVNVCHVPPGNPEAARTMNVRANALDAHLAHGDLRGECAVIIECRCETPNGELSLGNKLCGRTCPISEDDCFDQCEEHFPSETIDEVRFYCKLGSCE